MRTESSRFREVRARAGEWLDGVEGWLMPDEAAVLYLAALEAGRRRSDPCVVEIGSWKGRSAISLAKGLKDAGASGTLYAIDPHVMKPDIPRMSFDRVPILRGNLERAGVSELVTIIRERSHDARPRFENASVDVLFVDGQHVYEAVRQDIEDWRSTLRPPAIVAFNDYPYPGVRRALRELALTVRSPFRRARWRGVTILFDFDPSAPWSAADRLRLWRSRIFLLQEDWLARIERLEKGAGAKRLRASIGSVYRKVVRRTMRACLPIAE